MIYILYNPLANNGRGEKAAEGTFENLSGEKIFMDIRQVGEYRQFFEGLDKQDEVVLCGGDGTLQCFINEIPKEALQFRLYYCPAGSGNDFANDVGMEKGGKPVLLNPYLEHLPVVEFNGMQRYFLNNFAMGIDGYVCEKADEYKKRHRKKVNYTGIALKGLAYDYKPCKVTVTLEDGVQEFEHVWMTPTMKGRYFGGGMKVAPMQERLDEENWLTLVVVHQKSRFRLLSVFPKIFKGEHVGYTDVVSFFKVKHAKVTFEHPVSVQIDGEVYRNVQEYEVFAEK
jgi:diacylglycerol kinase family enzyme